MKRLLPVALLATSAASILYFSCGKTESEDKPKEASDSAEDGADDGISGSGTVELGAVDQIVQVTDPVVAYAADDTSASAEEARVFDYVAIAAGLTTTASTGVSLGKSATDIGAAFASANGSKSFCNAVNNGMKFFKEASSPDFNLCVLKVAAKAGKASLDNGVFKIWDFKVTAPEGSQTYRMKFKLEVDDAGSLTSFENFNCAGQGTGALKQTAYAKQTIADGKVDVHARALGMESDGFKLRVDMQANLGADGKPLGLKTIDYAEHDAENSRTVHTKVIQSAGNIQAIGYEDVGRVTQTLSFIELLDGNDGTSQYAVTKLAYGDGAAITRVTEDGSTTDSSQGWNGDTLVADAAEPRLAKVEGREAEYLSPTGDTLDLDFAAAETYDCSGDADYTHEAQMEDVSDCMAAFEIDQNGSQMCN